MTPENLLAEWSRLFVESLVDAGLADVVVSPGSRSTPLVWAALGCRRLRCTRIVDERSAAFFALGRAKVTGAPAAVLCTSGSAAANYLPAVVEASLSRTPLLVITADRPFELMDCGASQTIDQTRIFGEHARRFVELGMPDGSVTALRSLRRRAAQALFDAATPDPGPVHVNFRAQKPLEPARSTSEAAALLTARVDALLAVPITLPVAPRRTPPEGAVDRVAADVADARRGLIVCGPAPLAAVQYGPALARVALAVGLPVYAEATSQQRFDLPATLPPSLVADGLDLLLRAPGFVERRCPDVVIQIGQPPTSSSYERLIGGRPELVRHVICAHGWPDPTGTARSLIVGDIDATLLALAASLEARRGSPRSGSRWTEAIASANAAAWTAVDSALGQSASLSEGAAVRSVIDSLPSGALLALGNSLAVRHVDAFCRARSGIGVWSQRGASGIDGVVSGAAGAAEASGRPTALVLGDLSALHDLGGFAVAARASVPLVVIVLNNDGGRIFEQLPLAEAGLAEEHWPFWTTPHGGTFDGLAQLFPLRHVRAVSSGELTAALLDGLARPGCTLVEVPVPSQGARVLAADVAAGVEAAVQRLDGGPLSGPRG